MIELCTLVWTRPIIFGRLNATKSGLVQLMAGRAAAVSARSDFQATSCIYCAVMTGQ